MIQRRKGKEKKWFKSTCFLENGKKPPAPWTLNKTALHTANRKATELKVPVAWDARPGCPIVNASVTRLFPIIHKCQSRTNLDFSPSTNPTYK